MLNKIYLVLLVIAVIVMGFFTFYSYGWLQSIGDPTNSAEGFTFYSNLGLNFLWVSFLALLVLANILIWKNGRSWSIWTSLLYFAVFMVVQTFFLAPSFLEFKKSNSLTESNFSATPLVGAMTIIVVAIAVFFIQFIAFRLRQKMVGSNEKEVELVEKIENIKE